MREIFVIDNGTCLTSELKGLFKEEKEFKIKPVKSISLDNALKNIPDLFIVNEDTISEETLDICKTIRQNEDNSITPIIVVSSNKEKEHRLRFLESDIEYYIGMPMEYEYLFHTIKNIIRLIYVNRRISPLTGLPGNVQIDAELKKRLLHGERFSVLYFDLDNFKAYNDVYGFLKGDEVIKATAKLIQKNVHSEECLDSFVGHIGGDDFVAIVAKKTDYEEICKNLIIEFDHEIVNFYSEKDIKKGYVEVANRKNIIEQFPIVSISIGVVVVDADRFKNRLEIGEIGAQVKHLAKTIPGSTYVINRSEIEKNINSEE